MGIFLRLKLKEKGFDEICVAMRRNDAVFILLAINRMHVVGQLNRRTDFRNKLLEIEDIRERYSFE